MIYGLSLTQPWPALFAIGATKMESRSWGPDPRRLGDWIAIHATRENDAAAWAFGPIRAALLDAGLDPTNLPLKQVVALARLRDRARCGYTATPAWWPEPGSPEYHFHDFSHGRWAWYFDPVIPLQVPVAMRGQPSIYPVDAATATLILAQIDPKDLPHDAKTPTPD